MSAQRLALAAEIGSEVLEIITERRRPRGSTYRLQFNAQFTFRDAKRLVPYLHKLGITHVYASPYLQAQPGSPHGYDVCRHDELNPEIGTAEDYAAFVAALADHGLGQVLDVVPNHMAASSHNPWWMDVLENGPSSPLSHYFDIDWHPVKEELAGKVLLPILGEQYGKALESGQLRLELVDGGCVLRYFDHVLPIGPRTLLPLLTYRIEDLKAALGEGSDSFLEYQSIITALQHLPPASTTTPEKMAERQREKEVVRRRMRRLMADEPAVGELLRENVRVFNGQPGDPRSFDQLDDLLRSQAYRLCHWRSASDEVNYRRFFDVNGLAAICQESADVFERTHRLIMQLLARGDIDGLRIDHIDGLLDPTRYLWRLQWAYLAELAWRVFSERAGQPSNNSLSHAPMLAIVREEPVSLPLSTEKGLQAREAAESIESVVMEQLAAEESRSATSTEAEPSTATWSELRPLVLRFLCDRLKLPHPDRALLQLGNPAVQGAGDSMLETTGESDVYERSLPGVTDLPLYVVVEKILGPDEPLPNTWPVAGTTGYDFLQLVNGLLVDAQGFRELVRLFHRFTGEKLAFSEVMYRSKQLILRFSMSSELQMLAHQLNRISEDDRCSRDFTLNMLRLALRETLASFPVYRTYAGPAGVGERDRRFVNQAIARAKWRSPAADAAIFDFLRGILLLEHREGLNDEERHRRELFTGRFQQVTSPVMAKGVEDTAFYLFCPLVSVNEVGSHPDVAPVSVQTFHQDNVQRRRQYPATMLATSTHDTKRSEDVRARMNVLAEMPQQWRKTCNYWVRLNRRYRRMVDGRPAPSREDEYLFYQTLVGCWPISPPGSEEYGRFICRLQAYMEKATHEAKMRTSWVNPNAAYDQAVREFVAKTLENRPDNRFLTDFKKFHESIVVCGLYNALSQAALKILSPGVPDIYQSQEIWDFSLVDPDNRRPVDYDLRRSLLDELEQAMSRSPDGHRELAQRLAVTPHDPRLKLFTTWRLLQLRKNRPRLFMEGEYAPVNVVGAAARHVCAFTWRLQQQGAPIQQVLVAIPRFLSQLATPSNSSAGPQSLWSSDMWGNTQLEYGFSLEHPLRNVCTGSEINLTSSLPVAKLFADYPVAVLASDE